MFVKICGMNSPEAVEAAVEAGADALGFVFAESPRQVTPEHANALCANVPAHVTRVAVMRHPHKEQWERVIEVFEPSWLQTDAEDFRWIELPPSVRGAARLSRQPTRRPTPTCRTGCCSRARRAAAAASPTGTRRTASRASPKSSSRAG